MSVASFIPKLWESAIDVPFNNALVFGQERIANRKYEGQISQAGDTVTINSIGKGVVKDYDKTKDIAIDELTTTELKLTIDQEKYFAFRVHDVDRVQAAGDFQGPATEEHAVQLRDAADKYMAAKLVAGATNKLTATTVFDGSQYFVPASGQRTAWDVVRDIKKKMDAAGVPEIGRWLAVGTEFASALLADPRVTEADKAGDNTILLNGQLTAKPVLGFEIVVSNNIVAPKAGTETLVASVPGAFSFANQLLEVEAYRDPNRFGDIVRGLNVYGAAVTKPDAVFTVDATVGAGTLPSGSAPAA